MNGYLIVTDSSCDLSADMAKELGVKVIKLAFIVEGEEAKANDAVDEKQFYELDDSSFRQQQKVHLQHLELHSIP